MKKKGLFIPAFLLILLTTASVYAYSIFRSDREEEDVVTQAATLNDFSYAAEVATPAVVHIKSLQEVKGDPYQRNPFEELLKEYYGEDYQAPKQKIPPSESIGSGVILSADGFIVTNNHVVQSSSRIEVVLNDKRSYIAKVIGTDPSTDLALLKINEKNLSFIKFGKSDNLKVGSWVVAVGNPFNLNSTVTAGIVSAKGRSINVIREENNMGIESFIQTDAVVNPGNSGGALVNIQGELIGINTAIASPTGAFAGYAFAVPESIVKKVVDDLLKYGEVQRALLGVVVQDINAAFAKEKGLNSVNGIYVANVAAASAAQKAGLKVGDIIVAINGTEVQTASRMQEMIAILRPGDKIKITYLRAGQKKETDAVLQNKTGGTTLTYKSKVESPAE